MARVLVIGATSGIAAAACRQLADRGDQLFLVARSRSGLDALAAELGDAVVGTCQHDVTDTGRAGEVVQQARDALDELDVVHVCHGLLPDQLDTEARYETAEESFAVNLLGTVALLVPLVNVLEAQGRGKLAVITSVAAERGRPRNYTYASAKAALNTYLEGVRSRLYGTGVSIHIIKMGPVDTKMTVDHDKNPLFATAEGAAAGMIAAVDRGRFEAFVPGYWRPIMAAVRHLPEPIFQRIGFLSGR